MRISARVVAGVVVALLLEGCGCGTDEISRGGVTFTLGSEFGEGNGFGVEFQGDALTLSTQSTPCNYLNVAASRDYNTLIGTVVRIDVNTGAVVGEYATSPDGRSRNPSRTTVDLHCNVWCSNRDEAGFLPVAAAQKGEIAPHGSTVKIGLCVGGTRGDKELDGSFTPNPLGEYLQPPFTYNTCVDRDGDGLIRTSNGLGNILAWPDVTDGGGGTDGIVMDALDEAILIYQRLPYAPNARHTSVDADNNVWVGGYPFSLTTFYKLDGETGAILDSFTPSTFGAGGYGGLVDGAGILWSASLIENALLRYDPVLDTGTAIPFYNSYGTGIDSLGNVWNSSPGSGTVLKVSPAGVVSPGFPKPTFGAGTDRGVAVTPDDHVWIANSGGSDVSRLDNDGNFLKAIPVGSGPHGVAVDSNGKVWSANYYDSTASRIDPAGDTDGLGIVDMTVPLSPNSTPYNYSDMTGAVVFGATSPQGTWTAVYDSASTGQGWGTAIWNTEPAGSEPPGTQIIVEVRAAESEAGLSSVSFLAVANGVPFSITGRFIEVRATLIAAPDDSVPVLSDLTILPG